MGTYADDSSADVTPLAQWTSSDTSVASADSDGLVRAIAPGEATITATIGAVSGTFLLTVISSNGGTVTLSKDASLIGNSTISVSGTGWRQHSDSSVTISECAGTAYSVMHCANLASASVETAPAAKAGDVAKTSIRLTVGSIDSDGDTCGLVNSPACYIVMVGNTGDSTASSTLRFSTPTLSIHKTTGVLGNYADALKASGFPIGDTVEAAECDASVVAPTTVSTHCDSTTQIAGTVATTGKVTFSPTDIQLLVGGDYSDGAGGTCLPGETCDVVITDLDNAAIGLSSPLVFATPTATVKKTADVAQGYVDTIKAGALPIGDTITAQECDPSVSPASDLDTHCDVSTQISGTVASNGKVTFSPAGVTVEVGGGYSDASGGSCGPGGSCFIVINDATDSGIDLVTPISLAS